ncbi:unnamed protein product [Nezara viridula]|uniref:Uncharacterized protein n=1 Tax=Nezara viridula TaxID=85310 RepID=A0A9P0HC21_NEZVI|nr:unnamed protein product [Nezara viridula]CAH1395691.1 unnamed protein product [Nezara viridula]CAH1399215.1 unnamed protein product [Nezara viridula]CAH1400333.1 unnamed protein product [Nezara viridula]
MSARQLAGSSGLSDQAVLSKLLKRKVRSTSSISSKDGTNEKKRASSNNSVIKTTSKNPKQKQTYVNSHNLPNSTNTEMNTLIIENNNSATHIIESILEHDVNNTGVPENAVQSSNATNTPTTINSIPNVPVSNRFEPLSTEMEDEPDETIVTHQPPPIKIKGITNFQTLCTNLRRNTTDLLTPSLSRKNYTTRLTHRQRVLKLHITTQHHNSQLLKQRV